MTRVDNPTPKDRNKYWALLRVAQAEFVRLTHGTEYGTQSDFEYFLERNYGIAPIMDNGQYTGSYNIVDDKRFLLIKIKHDI